MRLCSISSGSSGNSIYVGSATTHILVDAGISGKRIEEGLNLLDLTAKDLDAILITHEHADHIQGLGVLARKLGIPIYASNGTLEAIKNYGSLGKVDRDLFVPVKADESFTIKDISVYPIKVSHDAAEPLAYRLKSEGKSAGIITDLGVYTDYTIECLKGCDVLLAESNHDVRMLQVGSYPYYLKQRILGDRGHLSNENSGRLISALLHDSMKCIFLGHLSHENNLPELAYETVRLEIEASDNEYHGDDFPIKVAKRECPSEAVNF